VGRVKVGRGKVGRGKVGEGIMGMEKCVKRKGGKEKI
jgi:hypothetical protein